MSYRTAIFDLDGTLVDTIDLIVASFQQTHRDVLGRELAREAVLPWIGRTLVDIYAVEAPEHAQELHDRYIEWNLAHLEELQRTYDGIAALLADLRGAGVPVAVATSKRRHSAQRSLAAAHLTDAVDVLVGLEDTVRHKPDPAPVLRALDLLGADAEGAVYVGDAVADIQAAHVAGVASVAVLWGAGEEDALRAAAPEHVAATVAELRAVLLG